VQLVERLWAVVRGKISPPVYSFKESLVVTCKTNKNEGKVICVCDIAGWSRGERQAC